MQLFRSLILPLARHSVPVGPPSVACFPLTGWRRRHMAAFCLRERWRVVTASPTIRALIHSVNTTRDSVHVSCRTGGWRLVHRRPTAVVDAPPPRGDLHESPLSATDLLLQGELQLRLILCRFRSAMTRATRPTIRFCSRTCRRHCRESKPALDSSKRPATC